MSSEGSQYMRVLSSGGGFKRRGEKWMELIIDKICCVDICGTHDIHCNLATVLEEPLKSKNPLFSIELALNQQTTYGADYDG